MSKELEQLWTRELNSLGERFLRDLDAAGLQRGGMIEQAAGVVLSGADPDYIINVLKELGIEPPTVH